MAGITVTSTLCQPASCQFSWQSIHGVTRDMDAEALEPRQTIAELLTMHPQAAQAMNKLGMACVGCYLARFCSLDYVASSYNLDLDRFLLELQKASRPSISGF